MNHMGSVVNSIYRPFDELFISPEAYQQIKQWGKEDEWDKYFLNMLDLVKTRSPDKETQVSCILTENNRIISTGYNGWPSNIDGLPDTRPDKYPYMLHSEQNAICNLLVKPDKPTCYITHIPCNVCLKMLWQIGCRRIVLSENRKFFSFSDDDQKILDLFIKNGLIVVNYKKEETRFVRVGNGITELQGDFE